MCQFSAVKFAFLRENLYFCRRNFEKMKDLRFLFVFCLSFLSLTLLAQEEEELMQFHRPECNVGGEFAQAGMSARRATSLGSQATAPLKSKGVKRVPVILTAFKDKGFTISDTLEVVNAYYQKYCNGTMDGKRYTGHGSYGSIRDYFVMQSDSIFFPEFVVIGPIVMDSVASFYGKNGSSRDSNFHLYSKEAITKAYAEYSDWSVFDNDGNGTVDMVFFVFAGLGENNGGGADCIWPRETTSATIINDHVFATSAATCELRPSKRDETGKVLDTTRDGVGVFIHELSHSLGLPDFYDINGKMFGMDIWSVMDYGEYGNNGHTPGNYTAYERDFMGWRPLKTLDGPCVLTIPCFAEGGTGYKILNDKFPNEYYIIENRQAKGWDRSICKYGHGLQVTHVDYDAAKWRDNVVNTNQYHQRMTIIAANNCYQGTNSSITSEEWIKTLTGNLYPGDTFNYSLTDESTPAAQVFSGSDVWVGSLMHKPLRNITENEDGTITVCFCTNGKLETVSSLEVEDVQMDQFKARWASVENATRYAYELYNDSSVIRQDTIAETSLFIDELLPSSNLKLRVRAMADSQEDYVDGDWSEYCYFETLADYIDSVADSEKMVEVFTLGGVCVSQCKANQVCRLALHHGVYVVKYSNGSARKVVL